MEVFEQIYQQEPQSSEEEAAHQGAFQLQSNAYQKSPQTHAHLDTSENEVLQSHSSDVHKSALSMRQSYENIQQEVKEPASQPHFHLYSKSPDTQAHSPNRKLSLSRLKRHQYENTMFSVLGPGFQEGKTSFAQSDSGDDVQSLQESLQPPDGSFYFTGTYESRNRTQELDQNQDSLCDGEDSQHGNQNDSIAHGDEEPEMNRNVNENYAEVPSELPGSGANENESNGMERTNESEGVSTNKRQEVANEAGRKDHVTMTRGGRENGTQTRYTITSNVTSGNKLYSSVVIAQNSETDEGPGQGPDHHAAPGPHLTPESSTVARRASESDHELWNKFYDSNASHRSIISNIDDVTSVSDQSRCLETEMEELANQNGESKPEPAQLYRVNMSIHRLSNQEALSKPPSWLHKEFVNTAYVSD